MRSPHRVAYQLEYEKNWRRDNPEKSLLSSARRRALIKGLEFDLELSDIVIPSVCPVLSIPIFSSPGRATWNSPNLDRRDNSKGYVKGNVKVISMKANLCKSDLSAAEIKALYEYVFGLQDR